MSTKLCPDCGQPMLPPGQVKKPNEYDHAQGCPKDTAWLIRFDDLDKRDEVFIGAAAEVAALARFSEISASWNAHLFRSHPCSACASLRAELKTAWSAFETMKEENAKLAAHNRNLQEQIDELPSSEDRGCNQRPLACLPPGTEVKPVGVWPGAAGKRP